MKNPKCCGEKMKRSSMLCDPEFVLFQCGKCGGTNRIKVTAKEPLVWGISRELDSSVDSTFNGISGDNLAGIWMRLSDKMSDAIIGDSLSQSERDLYETITRRLSHDVNILSIIERTAE
jgi:hypothetical protein